MQEMSSIKLHCAKRIGDQCMTAVLLMSMGLAGFEKPSAIQQKGIVPFTKGLDVIQQAQSGTGKTATFCAGILNNLDFDNTQCQALVLAPTRELAQQIDKVMRHLGDYLKIKSHACVGGTSVREDTQTLSRGVHVVVGTPGRVFDMLRRGALRADGIKMFVLDEADEMLSRGFKDQIYDIFRMIPGQLQVLQLDSRCVQNLHTCCLHAAGIMLAAWSAIASTCSPRHSAMDVHNTLHTRLTACAPPHAMPSHAM